MAKGFRGQSSQACCPWNQKFAREVKEPTFEARGVIAGKEAMTLAREILAMPDGDFRAAFHGAAMKRAKLPGLERHTSALP